MASTGAQDDPDARRLYFAYGSNLSLEQMAARCPDSKLHSPCLAILRDYTWIISSRGYANVVPVPKQETTTLASATAMCKLGEHEEVVYGLLYWITPADEALLDEYEGVPYAYEKVVMVVEILDLQNEEKPVQKVETLVYIDCEQEKGKCRDEYVERMNRGLSDAVTMGMPWKWVEDVVGNKRQDASNATRFISASPSPAHLFVLSKLQPYQAMSRLQSYDSDSDDYIIPLQDQRVFGAGLKRKRIHFVPSSSLQPSAPPPTAGPSIAERYLSLVLPTAKDGDNNDPRAHSPKDESGDTQQEEIEICKICNLPVKSSAGDGEHSKTHIHEVTLPHQLSLPHSHPPSSISRSRLGLKILSAHGWNPDARVGLGKEGEGRQFPVKMKEKDDKLGIGVVIPMDVREIGGEWAKGRVLGGREKGVKRLDAKQVRNKVDREKKQGERLREMFYGREDVEKYLRN